MAENNTKQISGMLFLARDMAKTEITDIKPVVERDETRTYSPVLERGSMGGLVGTGFMTPDGRYPIIKSQSEAAYGVESGVDDQPNRGKGRVEHASLDEDAPKGRLLGRLKSGGAGGGAGNGPGTTSNFGNDSDSGPSQNKTSVIKRASAVGVVVSAVALAAYTGWIYLFAGPTSSGAEPVMGAANQGSADGHSDAKTAQGSLGIEVPAVDQGQQLSMTEKTFGTPPSVDTSQSDIAREAERNGPEESQTLGMGSVGQATTQGGGDVPTPKPSNTETVSLSDGVASDIDLSVSQLGIPSDAVPENGVNATADADGDARSLASSDFGIAAVSDSAVAPPDNADSDPEPTHEQSGSVKDQPVGGNAIHQGEGITSAGQTNQSPRLQNLEAVRGAQPSPKAAEEDEQSESEAADYRSSTISSITHSGRLLSKGYNADIADDSKPQSSVNAGALKATIGRLRAELSQVRRERNRIEAELDAKPDSLSYPGWRVMGTTGHDSAVLVGPSDNTRIVRTGDALWGSTVTEIDPNRQIVRTHDGIIRAGP